jgi:LAO/AO transport system kinase
LQLNNDFYYAFRDFHHHPMPKRLSVDEYTKGILSGNRVLLGRAISIIESNRSADRILAKDILANVLHASGKSIRIGITGVPGVGKSTFVETFGKHLTSIGKKVGVLTIDPSSKSSGGSVLGDKTRMETLSRDPLAYIRPSPNRSMLGGVSDSTREAIILCEAAGYEIILVETVGVGQSETMVHGMTDFFVLLMLAGAGDELQGIKKGIMEMADAVVINKADGANKDLAQQSVRTYENALHFSRASASGWYPKVMTASAMAGTGMTELWNLILKYQHITEQNGYFSKNRHGQHIEWLHETIKRSLEEQFYSNSDIVHNLPEVEKQVRELSVLPATAAERLLKLFRGNR